MMYALLRSLFSLESGRRCRVCGEGVSPADEFGVSEGVCRGCRD